MLLFFTNNSRNVIFAPCNQHLIKIAKVENWNFKVWYHQIFSYKENGRRKSEDMLIICPRKIFNPFHSFPP